MASDNRQITYEEFGAVGDGVTDDLPAVCSAHAHANENGLSVRSRPDATYHLGRRALTAIIATDTDWNTSRFTVDDTDVEDHKLPLFEVRSQLDPIDLKIDCLKRDQSQLPLRPAHDCHVLVENDRHNRYIRRGLNQNNGVPQHDCFILHRDGSIEGLIDWDYDHISRIEARPIDDQVLTLKGGIFTTLANRMRQDVGYNYWGRGIVVTRSNTRIEELTHYIAEETEYGHPYRGFIEARQCANITVDNCFGTGHKTYTTIGAAGKPVKMGSYDFHANDVVNFHMRNCRMNHITDQTRWGIIATNFCKNITLEDCTLSRMDTHMGVSGSYVIRRCTLGYMGLKAIGRGTLTVEDSTLYGNELISLRPDYGSTWEGNVIIRNCRWIPDSGACCQPYMIHARNDGKHDFGYPCHMPREVTIDGLFVDDSNHPEDYQGMLFFTDHAPSDITSSTPDDDRPFPYTLCQTIRVKNLTTSSGKKPRLSTNAQLLQTTKVVGET